MIEGSEATNKYIFKESNDNVNYLIYKNKNKSKSKLFYTCYESILN